jgi:LysM repeat protein
MVARNPARYLAPIALAAVVGGTYLVVQSNLTPRRSTVHHVARHRTVARGKFAKVTFYTVQANDTLTGISGKTGIPVPTLEALNPSIDPNALQTGQRLRLRR